MINFILRRVVTSVVLLIIISMVTFGVFFMVPKLAGTNPAELYVGKSATPADVAATARKLGLDKPIYVQYGEFMKGLVAGREYDNGPDKTHCAAPCFGYSFRNDRPVWPLLLDRLPVTISLTVGAAIIWLLGGVLAGVISALRRGSVLDRIVMVVALAGVSLPIYFTGLLAQLFFVHNLHWFKGGEYVNFADDPFGWANKLFLGWVTLALLYAATYARLTRAQMLETVSEDYIRTARAKGLRERVVVGKHAMRSVLTPIVTIFGLDLGAALGGAILTESVFSLPGIGRLSIDAVNTKDLPVVLGVTLFGAMFIVLANFLVDIVYAVIDPRVRLS
ncbi:ABC transporter permease [Planosporangium flavigriseum]|uniref:ABC transporter permease n=1 Tax=Planosporangium flavigriseum TaxID=373681 RepID=A0A8J3PLE9_9ACTN|nr:ABC transporter permease [Planosporangium flavigriseum]NJC66828.1 ABC transporter permease [Planosporangium flavigriseum]GIG74431.1 ABC transporter permease [Planosporangium flavigriseum]